MSSSKLSALAVQMLAQGIQLCLEQWTALQLALHNEWGGPASNLKAQRLHADILNFFILAKGHCYIDELEELLDARMLEFFNTELEDGSLEEVAEQIMVLHEECLMGNFESVRQLATAAAFGSKQSLSKSMQEQAATQEDENIDITGIDEVTNANVTAVVDGMDMDPLTHDTRSTVPDVKSTGPTADDLVDGWQAPPSRHRRRGRT